MAIKNGVCRKSDYILIRYGYCDFSTDGSFNEETEEQHEIPSNTEIYADTPLNTNSPNLTHWNGITWDLIARIE